MTNNVLFSNFKEAMMKKPPDEAIHPPCKDFSFSDKIAKLREEKNRKKRGKAIIAIILSILGLFFAIKSML